MAVAQAIDAAQAMDVAQAVDWAFKIAIAVGGWFVKVLFDKLKSLESADKEMAKAVNDMRIELPTHYVQKEEFKQMGDNIFAALRRIEDKMDKKADRHMQT